MTQGVFPKEVVCTHIIPYSISKITIPKGALNTAIASKAREILSLHLVCKETFKKPHRLNFLKRQFFTNKMIAERIHIPHEWAHPPLHLLIWQRRLASFKTLVRAGADINQADARGATPLHRAVKLELKNFVKYILQHPKLDATRPLGKDRLTALDLTTNEEIKALIRKWTKAK
jgi:hypothetical protein